MILWLLAALALGVATAFVARAKGRAFLPWLGYGTVLGVVALPHALLLEEREEDDDGDDDSPAFDLYTAMPERREPSWMTGAERPERAALYARDPHVRSEVSAVWSEDAFARIVGHPQSAATGESSDELPAPLVAKKGDASFVARRPEPAEPARQSPSEPTDEAPVPSPARAEGRGPGARDFLISDRASAARSENAAEDVPENVAEDVPENVAENVESVAAIPDGKAGARDDADAEPAFELRREDAWHPRESERESEEAFIARRFAPEPFSAGTRRDGRRRDRFDGRRRDRRDDRRRDRSDRGTGWRYAVAAACVALAVVLLWPGFTDLIAMYRSGEVHKSASATTEISPRPPATAPSGAVTSLAPDRPSDRKAGTGSEQQAAPANPTQDSAAPQAQDKAADQKPAQDAAVPQPPPLEAPLGSSSVARNEVTPPTSFPSPGSEAPPELPKAKPSSPPARKKTDTGNKKADKKAGTGKTGTREAVTAVGQVVVLVQAELKKRGYDPGEVNGRAGEKTREAIRAFKRKKGLPVDGSIDNALLENLGIVGQRLHPFKAAAQ